MKACEEKLEFIALFLSKKSSCSLNIKFSSSPIPLKTFLRNL